MAAGVAYAGNRRLRAPAPLLVLSSLFLALVAVAGGSSWNARAPLLTVELASIGLLAISARCARLEMAGWFLER